MYSNSNNVCKWGFELIGLNQAILFLTDCPQGAREGDPSFFFFFFWCVLGKRPNFSVIFHPYIPSSFAGFHLICLIV